MKAMTAMAVILASTLGMTACTRQVVVERASGSVGPSLVVEQFMQAANAKDFTTMARLFGTSKAPIAQLYPQNEVERRMAIFATELAHSDFEIMSDEVVPGRDEQARKLTVKITKEDKKFSVPFTVVRYKKDNWLIEQFKLDVLTQDR